MPTGASNPEPDYLADLRVALMVATEAVRALRNAVERAENAYTAVLVGSALHDAINLLGALGEAVGRARARVSPHVEIALGMREPTAGEPTSPAPPT